MVDPVRCLGSSACVTACPEDALGIVGGKAVLVNAAACIGHGACYTACPVDAIKLVFGTEKRGIDIPAVTPEFESNVPGIFIAGELGGMGLIRKAAEQGRRAIDSLRKRKRGTQEYDVVIVGCGPAGLSAGLSAIEHKLRYKLIEQEASLGGAVFHYPRNKLDVPGQESAKVVYRLIDPNQYDGQAVLVVGGGDSALEAAIALAERPGTDVTLSYRSAAFARVKQKNRLALDAAQRTGRIRVELESTVQEIGPAAVKLLTQRGPVALRNEAVIVCVGGQLPTPLPQSIGIAFDTKYGTQ